MKKSSFGGQFTFQTRWQTTIPRGQRLARLGMLILLLTFLLVGQVGIAGGTTPAPTVSETFDGAACGVTARLWNPRTDSDVASDTSNWVPSFALEPDSFVQVDATMKQPQITVEVDQDIDANALLLLADPTDGELVSISFTTGTSLSFSVQAADPDFCDGYATRPRPHPGARAPCAAPRAHALPSIPSAHAICSFSFTCHCVSRRLFAFAPARVHPISWDRRARRRGSVTLDELRGLGTAPPTAAPTFLPLDGVLNCGNGNGAAIWNPRVSDGGVTSAAGNWIPSGVPDENITAQVGTLVARVARHRRLDQSRSNPRSTKRVARRRRLDQSRSNPRSTNACCAPSPFGPVSVESSIDELLVCVCVCVCCVRSLVISYIASCSSRDPWRPSPSPPLHQSFEL